MKDRMQKLARYVDSQLPRRTVFFIMVIPLDDPNKRAEYVSNAQRNDIVTSMMEFIQRSQEKGFWGQHVDREN